MKKVDISVGQLVDEVKSGEIQLPVMQRRYVWRAKQVRDLLDSLYRGYPSGSILVWETPGSQPTKGFAVDNAVSPFAAQKLLLDGQQRPKYNARLQRLRSVRDHPYASSGVPCTVCGLGRGCS